jgi:oxygen-independent coproporphyrinogen-3 oxidase
VSAFGLYVHIPFCPQLCPYCAFAVVIGHTDWYERYVAAVCSEIRSWARLAPKGPLHTVYFGGGTPSMLEPARIERILDTAAAVLGLHPDAEITLEANPGTADGSRFAALRSLGCNRLSLGVQALHDADLRTLGRVHSAAEAAQAYRTARAAGFDNISVDVMFSIPGAPRSHWQHTLATLLEWRPEHISTYSLTIEEGTQLARRARHGGVSPVTEDDDAWAYARAMERLVAAGYEHYEVANFALPGQRSQHNWGYWHGMEYLGVGLSAHSFLDGRRHWNTRNMRRYITRIESGAAPCSGSEVLDASAARREQIWLQLRTSAGVVLQAAERSLLLRLPKFHSMCQNGLVQLHESRLRLTLQGFLLADTIAVDLTTLLEQAASQ